jgi:hypothetical protein
MDAAAMAGFLADIDPADAPAVIAATGALAAPDDLDSVEATIIALLDRSDPAEKPPIWLETGSLAARWRAENLADRIVDDALASKDLLPVRAAEIALAASAAHPLRGEALARYMERIVFRPMESKEARRLLRMIGLIANARPEWASRLEKSRLGLLTI